MDTFLVHEIDEMMEQLGYVDEGDKNDVGDAFKGSNVVDITRNDNMDLTFINYGDKEAEVEVGDNNKEGNPCDEFEIGDKFEHTNEVQFGDANKDGEDPWAKFKSGDKFKDINEDEFGDDSGYEFRTFGRSLHALQPYSLQNIICPLEDQKKEIYHGSLGFGERNVVGSQSSRNIGGAGSEKVKITGVSKNGNVSHECGL
ncbi:unnamed protein product [Lactuca saligna]|uniref:Uncharacterized protein n=1 Tax=Lactuca saligna TaxID=75948 RepID=A0AA35YIN1_LACSI|nr:unnamed protein product [Lactuca saligna]